MVLISIAYDLGEVTQVGKFPEPLIFAKILILTHSYQALDTKLQWIQHTWQLILKLLRWPVAHRQYLTPSGGISNLIQYSIKFAWHIPIQISTNLFTYNNISIFPRSNFPLILGSEVQFPAKSDIRIFSSFLLILVRQVFKIQISCLPSQEFLLDARN